MGCGIRGCGVWGVGGVGGGVSGPAEVVNWEEDEEDG